MTTNSKVTCWFIWQRNLIINLKEEEGDVRVLGGCLDYRERIGRRKQHNSYPDCKRCILSYVIIIIIPFVIYLHAELSR
jgi:hypothetical protein